jgi:RHS repeat-associated protein
MTKLIGALARVSGVLCLVLTALPAWSAVSLSSPTNNALYLAPAAAIPVRANASASGGATVVQVDFYADGNLIGTDTTSPYQFDWTNVAAGTYVITAKMTDSNQVETTSSPRTINVAANNTAPTVSLTAPANNASYISPSSVTATATASGPELNDLLQRVEFYLNGNLAATVTSAPYTTSLSGLADGTYSLTAVAVDGQGAQATSAARTFSIGQNQPPTVSITTPLDNSKWHSPAGFSFMVNAAAPETNDMLSVEFYANGNLLGTRTNAPWTFNVSDLAAGTYVLTAKAIDGQGANTTSTPRTIVVSDTNNNPTVSITAPAASSNFAVPAPSITVSASANAGEVNGWITRVEFYVNGQLVNTDTAGPFSFNWTNVPAGSYAITAKAVDQLNGETISAAVNVTVGAASIYFVHTDHLNTPRLITNNVGQAVWSWNNDDPFGANVPNENPSGAGTFTCNLRLPGQYFDKETNLHYNYFRDYAPDIGRYWQSDPIGLIGGTNTYSYVSNMPLHASDISGLKITGEWVMTPRNEHSGYTWEGVDPTFDWRLFPPTIFVGILHFQVYGRIIYEVKCTDDMNQCGQDHKAWKVNGARPYATPRIGIRFGPAILPAHLQLAALMINGSLEGGSAISTINGHIAGEIAKLSRDPTVFCMQSR